MKTVVIIGAGPAGLTAAYDLKKQSGNELRVILLEESGEIGGISRTVRHNGCRIDLGGHRFFSKNEQVNALWQEIMPMQGAPSMDDRVLSRDVPLSVGGPDPEREDRVMLSRHRVSRIYYLQKFFDYPISVKPQTFINMGFARTMKSGFGYLAARMHKLPVTSLENFYINQFGRPLYEMFFEHYTENLWGVHPSQIAPDWGAQRVKGLSLMKVFTSAVTKPFRKENGRVETSLIERFSYPKYGPGQFWETMAADAQKLGAELKINTRAVGFTRDENGRIASVIAEGADGVRAEIPCDAVFSSMPIKDLAEAMPGMPEDVKAVAAALPYRDFMTVVCWWTSSKSKTKPSSKRWATSCRTAGFTSTTAAPKSAACRFSTTGRLTWSKTRNTRSGSGLNISATRATRCGRCPTRISSAWRRRKSSASAFWKRAAPCATASASA